MAPSFGLRKKKNTKKKVLIISGISATVLLIAGFLLTLIYTGNQPICEELKLGVGLLDCKAEEAYVYDKIAIVAGNTMNAPAPDLSEEAEKYIRNSSYKHKVKISIYSAASNRAYMPFSDVKINNDDEGEELTKKMDDRVAAIKNTIKKAATATGAQYLDAIINAKKSLTSNKDEKLLIIVIGSGLSDGGTLNFTQGDLIHKEPGDVINALVDNDRFIPDRLSGIDVYWSGIGAVASPQNTLTEPETSNLIGLYTDALTSMGAEIIEMSEDAASHDPSVGKLYVAPIPTEGPKCDWCVGKSIGSETIGFEEDKSTLNEEKALSVLGGLIKEMKDNSGEKVKILGYVSLIKHDCSIARSRNVDGELARKRAYAVKNFLEKHGISADRITADKGPGDGKGPEDECAGGRYNSEKAKKNMIITIQASA